MPKNKVMVVAAHPDDEVLGCGATIARHVSEGDEVQCIFMTNGEGARDVSLQNVSSRINAAIDASKILGCLKPIFFDYPDNMMDTITLLDISKSLESLTLKFEPDLVYTHSSSDLNIDHRKTLEATLVCFRPQPDNKTKQIFSFDIPSATGWAPMLNRTFSPNHFVGCGNFLEKKLLALDCYKKEIPNSPHVRSIKSIKHRLSYFGSQVGIESAEAFELLRSINR